MRTDAELLGQSCPFCNRRMIPLVKAGFWPFKKPTNLPEPNWFIAYVPRFGSQWVCPACKPALAKEVARERAQREEKLAWTAPLREKHDAEIAAERKSGRIPNARCKTCHRPVWGDYVKLICDVCGAYGDWYERYR
jgi:hypothetical protein